MLAPVDAVEVVILIVAIAALGLVVTLASRALSRSLARDATVELELEGSKQRRQLKFFVRHDARDRVHEGAVLDLRVAEDDPARIAVDPALRVL